MELTFRLYIIEKKYRLENGKEWWEQWFTIKEVENKETKI